MGWPSRRILVGVVLAVVIVAGIGFGVSRSRSLNGTNDRLRAEQASRERSALDAGQRAYRMVPMRPVDSLDGPLDGVWLEGMDIPAERRGDARELLAFVRELLRYRYVVQDPAAYRDWRDSLGYVMRDRASVIDWGTDVDFEHLFGEPLTDDVTTEELYLRMWPTALRTRDGALAASSLAANSDGIGLAFGRMCPDDQHWPRLRSRAMTTDEWHGVGGGTMRTWFVPPGRSYRARVAEGECLDVARVGVLLEFERGDRYAISFIFYRDPQTRRWWHVGVGWLNIPNDRGAIGEW